MDRKLKTTFYEDFSMAEMFGKEAIIDTYRRCLSEWTGDVEYFTEFVVALNHKIRERHWKENKVERLYIDLRKKADSCALDIFQDEDKEYYIRESDNLFIKILQWN